MNVQIIVTPGGEELVVLPRAEYDHLCTLAEDAADILAAEEVLARVESGQEEVFPAEVVDAILDGVNPVKAVREHRGLTQRQLAEKAGLNPVYLSQIETGKRQGSLDTLRAIAAALNVDIGILTRG